MITAIGVQTDMATPALDRFGSDELKKEFLTPSILGDLVSAIAVSEPGAGSDVASIKTTAQKTGDDYVINEDIIGLIVSKLRDYGLAEHSGSANRVVGAEVRRGRR